MLVIVLFCCCFSSITFLPYSLNFPVKLSELRALSFYAAEIHEPEGKLMPMDLFQISGLGCFFFWYVCVFLLSCLIDILHSVTRSLLENIPWGVWESQIKGRDQPDVSSEAKQAEGAGCCHSTELRSRAEAEAFRFWWGSMSRFKSRAYAACKPQQMLA